MTSFQLSAVGNAEPKMQRCRSKVKPTKEKKKKPTLHDCVAQQIYCRLIERVVGWLSEWLSDSWYLTLRPVNQQQYGLVFLFPFLDWSREDFVSIRLTQSCRSLVLETWRKAKVPCVLQACACLRTHDSRFLKKKIYIYNAVLVNWADIPPMIGYNFFLKFILFLLSASLRSI